MKIEEKTILWKPVSEYTGGRVLATNGLDVLIGELNPEGDCVSEDCSGIHLCGITHFAKIDGFFPELTESEDERIRKELLAWLKSTDGQTLPIDRYNAAIAWLEKQGEQKSVNWNELTWEDINDLETIMNEVHSDFRNGIGEKSFGLEVLERFLYNKDYEHLDIKSPKFKNGDEIRSIDGQYEDTVLEVLSDGSYRLKNLGLLSIPENEWELVNAPVNGYELIDKKEQNTRQQLENQGEPTDINPSEFDLHLNNLLKQFETLPKEELASSLSFYLNVVQNDGTYKDEEKQGEQNPIINVPSREVILAIWDLGNEWKELTNGSISTEHGTQLDYIQKHWHESEYYLREKQGEQKPIDKVEPKDFNSIDPQFGKSIDKAEPKFHEGDWITNGDYTWKIVEVKPLDYILQSQDGNIVDDTISHVDEQFHSFAIEDAKYGDVLSYRDGQWIFIYKEKIDNNSFFYHALYSTIHQNLTINNSAFTLSNDAIVPATKEQRDLLFQKMHEACYEWNAEKKESKKIDNEEVNGEDYGIDGLWHAQRILEKTLGEVDGYQTDDGILEHKCAISAVKKLYEQNPAWSEEDEVGLANAIWAIKQARTIAKDENDMGNLWYAERWLKSIKDRIQSKFELTRLDKNILEAAVAFVEQNNHFNCWRGVDKHTVLSALHSLRPQNRWKPSEEQMEALDNALSLAKNCGEEGAFDLRTLYEQLKKLKGE